MPAADPAFTALLDLLACPACEGPLTYARNSLRCNNCGATYGRGPEGYFGFAGRPGPLEGPGARLTEYARRQESGGSRFVERFLAPYLSSAGIEPSPSGGRILDAGCGVGEGAARLAAAGYGAFGIDLGTLAPLWARADRDPTRFVSGDVTRMPFADHAFDLVTAFGVIEHVGTLTGHLTLAPDAEEQRARFAAELVRVVGPGGRILISCPNRRFPLDLHHGPADAVSPRRRVREAISHRTGVSVHAPWGRQALLSFGDLRRLFAPLTVEAISARGYFAFGNVPAWLRGPARTYVEGLPAGLRTSAANPFVIAEIRTDAEPRA